MYRQLYWRVPPVYRAEIERIPISTFVSLGSRGSQVGVPDAQTMSGLNPGNWTVQFSPQDIGVTIPYFEICHINVNGAPASNFSIFIDTRLWDTVLNGTQNSWDPTIPMPVNPGNYIYFCWSNPDTDGQPPEVTIWLRYDQDIYANQKALLGQGQGS